MREQSRPAEILLIEDNPGDIELIRDALQFGRVTNRISVATDGETALAFLNRARGFEDAPLPDLILLDLNLPKKDGFEVLKEVKDHPVMSRVPVVILTSSHADRDILKSYNLHANCFISKPVDVDEFLDTVRSTGEFWLSIVKLPAGDGHDQLTR
jgi:chemotaxis family two-component system response regulator Rcp1